MVMTGDGINTRRDHAQIPSSILRGGDLGAEVVMFDDVLSWCRFLYEMCAQPMIVINVADKGKADNMIGKLHHELRQTQQLQFDMTSSSGGGNWFILIIPKGASKGSAALHVSKRLGFAPEQVHACMPDRGLRL